MKAASSLEDPLKLADELLSFSDVESTRGRPASADIMRRAETVIRAHAKQIAELKTQMDDVRKALKTALLLTN